MFSVADILQTADVIHQVVFLLFLLAMLLGSHSAISSTRNM